MSIQNVRKYFSSPAPSSPKHTKKRSKEHRYESSVSTCASISPLKHSFKPYEEGTVTNDFLGFDQAPSSSVRSPYERPSKLSTEPLCFSTDKPQQ